MQTRKHSPLDHTVSRQTRWQRRQQAAGRCVICGLLQDGTSVAFCSFHLRIRRELYAARKQHRQV